MLPNFEFVRPKSLTDAVRELQGREAAVLAGGTELLGAIRDNISQPAKLVSLSGISELRGIKRDLAGRLHIGALTTLSEIQADEELKRTYPALVPPAHNYVIKGRSVAICANDRGVGISAEIFIVCARVETSAMPLTAKMSTTAFSAALAATSFTRRIRRRPWWPCRRKP